MRMQRGVRKSSNGTRSRHNKCSRSRKRKCATYSPVTEGRSRDRPGEACRPTHCEREPAEVQAHDLPDEVSLEISKGNFVRAVHLAIEKGVPRDSIRNLQSNAVRQFIEVLHKFEGAKGLISTYDLSSQEVRTILQNILHSPRARSQSLTWFNHKKGKIVATTLAQRIEADPTLRKYL